MKSFSLEKIVAAFYSSFQGWRRKTALISISLLTYFFFTFNTNIPWNTDILLGEPLGFIRVVQIGTATLIEGSLIGFGLKIIYSLLIGVTMVNFGIQLSQKNLSKETLGAMLPGFIAGGCGCGIGMLGILGIAGAVTALPFQGNLVILAGMLLMTYSLNEMGDPEKCDIDVSINKKS